MSENKTIKAIDKFLNTSYDGGIPKNWKTIDVNMDNALKNANPSYNKGKEYKNNCPNCVNAYEMRKRGYDVVAKPTTKNRYLNYHPEEAWKDIQPIKTSGNGLKEIVETVTNAPEGSRFEVAITFKSTKNTGHVFVAENHNGKVSFLDPQSGSVIKEELFDFVMDDKTLFWRIDDADFSDRCITSCERR